MPGIPVYNSLAAAKPEIAVPTFQAALALQPQAIGTRIRVSEADQRAGTFEVQATSRATDICTCHPFDSDLSSEQTLTIAKTALTLNTNYVLPHQNIAFGSVKIYYDIVNNPNNYFTDLEMHGMRMNPGSVGYTRTLIDHAAGTLLNDGGFLQAAINSTNVTIKYKYINTPSGGSQRRLVRILNSEQPKLNVNWAGIGSTAIPYYLVGATPSASDARDYICWVMRVAERCGIKEIYIPNWYSFYGTIEIPSGVTIRGVNWETSGLRLMDEQGVRHYRTDFNTLEPRWRLGGRYSVLIGVGATSGFNIEDLQIDGNLAGNIQWLTSPGDYASSATIENELQNSPSCNGIATTNHSSRTVSNGTVVQLDRVWVKDTLSSCYLFGNYGNVSINGGYVRVGSSLRNHNFYIQTDATFNTVELNGYAWEAGLVLYRTVIDKLIVRNTTANPYFLWSTVCQKRNPHVSNVPQNTLVAVRTFEVDLSNLTSGNIPTGFFAVTGDNFRLGDGKIKTPANNINFFIAREGHNGYQVDLHRGWSFGNILMEESGTGPAIPVYHTTSTEHDFAVEDFETGCIQIKALDPTVNWTGGESYIQVRSWYRNSTWTRRKKFKIRFHSDSKRNYVFGTDVGSGSTGLDMYVHDSRWDNSFNQIIRNFGGGITVAGLSSASDVELVRWFFENCEFNIIQSNFNWLELTMRISHWKNCTDLISGRKSESSGLYTFTASGGETTALIQANLWYQPAFYEVIPNSATTLTRGITKVEVSDSGGTVYTTWDHSTLATKTINRTNPYLKVTFANALQAGDAISLRWQARIRFPGDPSVIPNP